MSIYSLKLNAKWTKSIKKKICVFFFFQAGFLFLFICLTLLDSMILSYYFDREIKRMIERDRSFSPDD